MTNTIMDGSPFSGSARAVRTWVEDKARRKLSMKARRRISLQRVNIRLLTAHRRMLPNLLMIGGHRCGSSSLYKYLEMHPEISASIRKEVEYFTLHYYRGLNWYRAHYPLRTPWARDRYKIVFEATPDYLLDPRCPGRAVETLGDVLVLAVLRDPADRAVSHYWHSIRSGLETLSIEKAIHEEENRLAPARAELALNPRTPLPFALRHFSYVTRGRYAEQLERWLMFVPRHRMLVVQSEELFANPRDTYGRITDFLGIERWFPSSFKNYSYAAGRPPEDATKVDSDLRAYLRDLFAEPNARLTALLGEDFGW